MSGSAAMRFRNVTIALLRIEHPFIHVDVDDLRAAFDLVAGDAQRRRVIVAPVISLRQTCEPVTLVRSPTFTKVSLRPMLSGSRPRQPQFLVELSGTVRGALCLHRIGNGLDMCGRGAAAAADDVDEPACANSSITCGMIRASRHSRSDSGLGRPAFGYAQTAYRRPAIAPRCADAINSAPSAQLSPTENGRALLTEFQKASGVCPESVRPEASVMVPEIMTGTRMPWSSKY